MCEKRKVREVVCRERGWGRGREPLPWTFQLSFSSDISSFMCQHPPPPTHPGFISRRSQCGGWRLAQSRDLPYRFGG